MDFSLEDDDFVERQNTAKSHRNDLKADRPTAAKCASKCPFKTFSCSNCSAVFKYERCLKRHFATKCQTKKARAHKCSVAGCVLTFYHEKALLDHIKTHNVVVEETTVEPIPECSTLPVPSFSCPKCNVFFSSKFNLMRHQRKCCCTVKAKRACYVAGCPVKFYHEINRIKHLEKAHSASVSDNAMSFQNMGEFLDWKEREQASKYVYLSKVTGKVIGPMKYSYFVCQHDGHRRSATKLKSSRKNKKGTAKFGITCPARLLVKENISSGLVSARYVSSHSHKFSFENTKFHPMSIETKQFIRQQLSLGIPAKQVRDSLCQSAGTRENRESNFVLRKENFTPLRSIKQMERKLKLSTRLHSDDAMSVMLTVQKLQSESYDPVLIYKPAGGKIVVGDCNMESLPNFDGLFLLGLQTKEQRDCLKSFATKILCIDSTHCTNQYGFQLLNLVVQDEANKGYPVAHLISSRMNEDVLHFFFLALKEKCPDLVINAVMTDDDYAPWNALTSVFGSSAKHLLCTWHVMRAWSRRLRSSTLDTKLYGEMFTALRVILYCSSQVTFQKLIEGFCLKYSSCAQSFVHYFVANYCNRPEVWAMCYRVFFAHGNTNTNMLVESFHNRLKTFYMNRIPNRRLDDLINLLLRVERDDYLRRTKQLVYKECDVFNTFGARTRHERGLKISDEDVSCLSDGGSCYDDVVMWEVKSQSKPGVVYTVSLLELWCNVDLCMETCLELSCCGLCAHMFSCSCLDKSGICKHIHKVQSVKVRLSDAAKQLHNLQHNIIDDTPGNDEHGIPVQLYDAPSGPITYAADDPVKLLDTIHTKLLKLDGLIGNSSIKKYLLPHIDGVLSNLIQQCEAVNVSHAAPVTEMPPLISNAPNEKLEKQSVPKRMHRLSTKKPPSFLTSLSHHDKQNISKMLCKPVIAVSEDTMDISCFISETNVTVSHTDNQEIAAAKIVDQSSALSKASRKQLSLSKSNNTPLDLTETDPLTVPLLYNAANVMQPILIIDHGTRDIKNLTLLHLKSLENTLPLQVSSFLTQRDPLFAEGWVYGDVIDAFLRRLSLSVPHILCAETTVCLGLMSGSKCYRMWEGIDLNIKVHSFFPFKSFKQSLGIVCCRHTKQISIIHKPLEKNFWLQRS